MFQCRFCSETIEEASIVEIDNGQRRLSIYVCSNCFGQVLSGQLYKCNYCGNIFIRHDCISSEKVIIVNVCDACKHIRR